MPCENILQPSRIAFPHRVIRTDGCDLGSLSLSKDGVVGKVTKSVLIWFFLKFLYDSIFISFDVSIPAGNLNACKGGQLSAFLMKLHKRTDINLRMNNGALHISVQ